MNRIKIVSLVAITVGMLFISGCGDTTRNDQGISFSLLGFFDNPSGGDYATVVNLPLSSLTESGSTNGGQLVSFADLSNNLTGQVIRVERMFMEYTIPGSNLNIPNTSSSMTGTLGPQNVDTEGADSTLPDNLASLPNRRTLSFVMIPTAIREYLNLNRTQLPEPPFVMIISAYASGVTSAGKRIDTNIAELDVYVQPDLIITPSGSSGSSSTAGSEASETEESEVDESESDEDLDFEF